VIKIGDKVRLHPNGRIRKNLREDLRDCVGIVYANVEDGKGNSRWRVALCPPEEFMPTPQILAFECDLKVVGEYDLQEVKAVAVQWGANPFEVVWDRLSFDS
jgi:hypothetical protein